MRAKSAASEAWFQSSPSLMVYKVIAPLREFTNALAAISSGQADLVSPTTVPSAQSAGSRAPQMQYVVLFDGVCNLCNWAVTWLLEHDKREVLHFGALQSTAAQQLLERHNAHRNLPDSIVFIDNDGVHTRSDAALRIASHLGMPWSLLTIGRLLPRFLRDAMYRWIARHRYRWFGRRDTCMLPSAGVAERFLSDSDVLGSRS